MSIQQVEKAYFYYVKKIMDFNEAIALAAWDMRTGAPKNGIEQRSEVVGTLSDEVFKRSTSEEMKGYIDALTDPSVQDSLSERTKRSIEKSQEEYSRNVNIPPEEYKAYIILQTKAESVWEEAKEKSNFSLLQPYLEKIVDYKKRFIRYWGEKDGSKYNTLLDLYEPGISVDVIDRVFKQLREGIVPLVKQIAEKNNPDTTFLNKHFPKDKQREFSIHMLKKMGYDFNSGRLDETMHPFEITLNPGDVRVTTHYLEDDFKSAIFGTIHEGGHALYEQHISKDLIGTPLCTGTSMGIHESQSLFFENMVGRSYAFWEAHYDELKKYSSGQFDHVSLDEFYRAINVSKPSFIRIDADELTYPLHIMVRYELEKGLFDGDLHVKDLPGVWNEKMKEYLGIVPTNDREGVLQDIHWPGGDFGYFPSYALGYVYAAQFKHSMLKAIPDFDHQLKNGHIDAIRSWLTEHIHQYGSLKKPLEIILDTTGETINPDYLITYFNEKYKELYGL
ncbi:carboxypeptidase M32 [Terrilactibacillus sp. BCM23-1]|uniref:Metal-dependent carboxypeptidase n=1 Tax=Terrilactibacillus tamarindi TaxID=2599694 RepID=A0A6N8CTD7_9BACI|nr:carboxypeptidase M32 [Terrilactibacillus tamarindi]MTT32928.1 carboxypeptidase M32 [Terrilactibacillus tamarindi]